MTEDSHKLQFSNPFQSFDSSNTTVLVLLNHPTFHQFTNIRSFQLHKNQWEEIHSRLHLWAATNKPLRDAFCKAKREVCIALDH